MKKEIIIGTRGSKLALFQAAWVAEKIKERNPAIKVSIRKIKTKGDKITDVALSKIGDKGLFVKEIENELIDKKIDLAVHSCKDLPTLIPSSLHIGAIIKREDAHDVLISRDNIKLSNLPLNSKIGTSSLRRKAQIINFRDDLKILDLRGNLDTRIKKLQLGEFDAIVVAYAGVKRLGFSKLITQKIPYSICLPAVGQGAIAIEIRCDDYKIRKLISALNDYPTYQSILAERSLLSYLEGGCQIPIGAFAKVENDRISLSAIIASLDGQQIIRKKDKGSIEKPEELGERVGEYLFKNGGEKILEEIRRL